ncbi:conserved hypothetical protein [Vibrio crassostreae]|nr:conserved hypothetical protein [Vibrio crassostreae]
MSTTRHNAFKPLTWPQAERELSRSLGGYLSTAQKAVMCGDEVPFLINGATILLRPEHTELVVVGYTGKHTLAQNAPLIHDLAKDIGAQSIRIHTQRKGELRFLERLGLGFYLLEQREHEFVLRCNIERLTHGR